MSQKMDFAQGEQKALARDIASQDGWVPLIDWSSVYPGNRGVSREGRYEPYDVPVGLQLRIEPGEKIGPLFTADLPWDNGGNLVPNFVWQADNQYHMLYLSYPPENPKYPGLGGFHNVCYASSDDGYTWTRPNLNQVEWEGSTENNIIKNRPEGVPFLDPQAPPEQRYKSIGQVGGYFDAKTGGALTIDEFYPRWKQQEYEGDAYKGPRVVMRHWIEGWCSPDAIHWEKMGKLADMASDGGNAAQYDPETKSYYAYIRVGAMGRRATGLSRTKDFAHWPPAELVLCPDPQDAPDESFYSLSYFRYPTNPGLHCGFVEIYHQLGDYNDAQITFSYDMNHWFRPERRAIIPCGDTSDACDCAGARPWGGLFTLPDGYWATMYRGHNHLHNYRPSEPVINFRPGAIMMARWLPHRFCGIEAETGGRFTIITVKRTQKELRLNYRCRTGGYIAAELIHDIPSRIHPDADPIPGYSFAESDLLTGDEISKPMTWQGKSDLSGLGDRVAIRLRMFGAKLFAYSI